MKLKIYQYPKCSTCRNAVKSLEQKGYELTSIHISEHPPTVTELKELVHNSGLDIKRFFNTNGVVYRELKLKDTIDTMSEEEKLKLLASDGMLIRRPIVTDGVHVTVGYKEDEFAQVWG